MIGGGPATVGELGADDFRSRLAGAGLGVQLGPFNALLRVDVPEIEGVVQDLYRDYPLTPSNSVYSFHSSLDTTRTGPPRFRRMVRFSVDGRQPHELMPIEHALPVLEWGINLVIALRSHCFLMLHAAVLERAGHAMLMPAAPGQGKTTLCAALAYRGWRLLSDEFGLIRPERNDLLPIPRPLALKNESVEVMRRFAPDAFIGPEISGTRKGTVAHLRPPVDSIRKQAVVARARWVVFPQWTKDASLRLEPLPRAEAFMMLASNAFNYELLGEAAFRATRRVIEAADCYRLTYSDLDQAQQRLRELADRSANA